MRHRFGGVCLLLASTALAAGGCVVAAPAPPEVAVAAPVPFVWIGPGYYGGVYYHAYPGPGFYAPHRHYWR